MRNLRWLVLATVATACIALVAAVVQVVRRNDGPPPPIATAALTIKGFRSALYDRDHLRLRVSGDLVTVSNLKVFGPFSLGFLYTLVGRNLTFETFEQADGAIEPLGQAEGAYQPLSQALSLDHISALVAHQWHGPQLGRAELGPVTVIEHRQGREKVVLQAASCRVTAMGGGIVCRDGVVEEHESTVPFRELTSEGDTLTVTPITGATRAHFVSDMYSQAPVAQLR